MKTIAALFVLICSPAFAEESHCVDTEEMRRIMSEKFGEIPIFSGTTDEETVVEVWAGPTSWSAFATKNGRSCLLSGGDEYELPETGESP